MTTMTDSRAVEVQAQGGGEVVAYAVYAKSEEYPKPVLLPEYVGSMDVIRGRVLSKARREGFTGDFVERMAELGWWIEPLTLASAPPSAPVCKACGGSGEMEVPMKINDVETDTTLIGCDACNGTGQHPPSAPVGVEAVPGFSMDDMALCEAGVWSLQESDSHVQECQAVAISKLIQFVYAALAQQPAAVDGVMVRLAKSARELQRKNYGSRSGLHLDMIDWAREFDAIHPTAAQENDDA